jgi:N-acetylglutamate synthase-like GNAT family acetyltransferase
MKDMHDPRKTGISSITGKMVSIRHATSADLTRVEGRLKRLHADSDLANAEVTVASEDERLIGFGILRKEKDGGCVSLFEDGRRKGIGSSIVKHLMEYADITALHNAPGEPRAHYFSRSGNDKKWAGTMAVDPCRLTVRAPLLQRKA